MEKRIKVTDYEITPDVSEYLETRLKAVEKLVGDVEAVRCQVELGRSAKHAKQGEDQWFTELDVTAKGNQWHATAAAASIKASIDLAKDELVHQIRREKQLHRRVIRKGGQAIKSMLRFGK